MILSPCSAFENALTLQHKGHFAEAENIWRALIRQVGEDPELLHHLGESCFLQKHYDAAVEAFRASLTLKSTTITACALSCALGGLGRNAEAAEVLAPAREAEPDNPRIWLYTGNAYAADKQTERALTAFRRAAELAPGLFPAQFNTGNMLIRLGRAAEAEPFFRQALRLKPGHIGALNNLGNVLMIQNRPGDAIPLFEEAIRRKPDFARSYYNLGHAETKLQHPGRAIPQFRKALALDPGYVRAWDKLGTALHATDHVEEAVDAYTHALALQPDLASARFGIATCRQIQGDFDAAHRETRRAIALAPDRPFYWNALVMTKTFHEGDPDIAEIENLAARAESFSGNDKARVFFMLGKIYNDLGRYPDAFAAWKRGNALMRSASTYDVAHEIDAMEQIANIFSAGFLAEKSGLGIASDLPVFIVGMPRSGTSLIEQIIASHSDVYGAGELDDFSKIFAADICGGTPAFIPEDLTAEALQKLAKLYLKQLSARAPGAKRITDKMPGNFSYAGLIRLALPGAKIIHVHRDPRDCCLSCYSKLFIGEQPYTYSLKDLGRFYRGYEKLMAHWRAVLPKENFLDIQYEDLVDHFDQLAPKLLEFCGLDWQESCRDFYKTRRLVRTASQTQVRQPLYHGAIGRWQNFAHELKPLTRALAGGTNSTGNGPFETVRPVRDEIKITIP